MPNDDHIGQLKKGVTAWNAWRDENPTSSPDLSRANLSGANLIGANLREAILTEADLCGGDLSNSNLSGADLSGADLSRADLIGADLREANLNSAALYGANLREAILTEANLSSGDLINHRPTALPARQLAGPRSSSQTVFHWPRASGDSTILHTPCHSSTCPAATFEPSSGPPPLRMKSLARRALSVQGTVHISP
jgi:hypothetical protein